MNDSDRDSATILCRPTRDFNVTATTAAAQSPMIAITALEEIATMAQSACKRLMLLAIISTLLSALCASQCDTNSAHTQRSSAMESLSFTPHVGPLLIDRDATELGFRTKNNRAVFTAFTIMESSDGVTVGVGHAEFPSRGEARRYFEWKISQYTDVKRGNKCSRDGRVIGLRAEVDGHAAGKAKSAHSIVMWVVDDDFWFLQSDSVTHLQEYEARSAN